MNFTNVRLILAREVRDQLRDRRTLFMIFVLPILLYPLLGTAYFQMIQFQTQNSMTVLVVGGGQLASAPTPLIEGSASRRNCSPTAPRRRIAEAGNGARGPPSNGDAAGDRTAEASRLVQAKKFDAALVFPPDFAQRLEAYRKAIHDDAAAGKLRREPQPRPALRKSGDKKSSPLPLSQRRGECGRDSPAQDHLHHGERTIADGLQPADGGAGSLDGRGRQDEPRGGRHACPGGAALRGRQREPGRRIGEQVDEHLVADAARDAVAVGDDRRVLSGGRPAVPARRSAARWRPC